MKRRSVPILVGCLALAGAIAFAWPSLDRYSRTGRFLAVDRVETLENPLSVLSWNKAGLELSDGRLVPLPGVRELPAESLVLAEATRRGVEIDPNGRVIGLVQVHHWCGSDPVRRHVARVDVAHLLMFFGENHYELPTILADHRRTEASFSEWGWNVSQFVHFQGWSYLLSLKGS